MNDSFRNRHREAQLDALWAEYLRACNRDPQLDRQAFLRQHQGFANELQELLETAEQVDQMAGPTVQEAVEAERSAVACDGEPVRSDETVQLDPSKTPARQSETTVADGTPTSVESTNVLEQRRQCDHTVRPIRTVGADWPWRYGRSVQGPPAWH